MSGVGNPDSLADRGLRTAAPALTRLARDINAHAAAFSLQAATDSIFDLLVADVGELIDAIADETFLADLQGQLSVDAQDLDRPLADFSAVPPKDAIEFFRQKKLMSAGAFKRLRDEYKQRAFAIAGLNNQHAIASAHEVLAKAIAKGTPQKQVLKDLRAYASTSIPNHAEIVFRTNVIGAYQQGRWKQLKRHSATRPYWQYVTAGDDRVRDDHQAMNGKVFAVDDEVWNQWYPPCGFACRCTIISLSRRELDREKLPVETELPIVPNAKPERRARPDKGWAVSPASTPKADKAVEKHRKFLAGEKMLAPPKAGRSGSRAYTLPGDLGGKDTTRKAAVVDKFAGIAKAQALQMVSGRPFMVGTLRRLKAGSVEARVPMASQYADGTDQLLRRLAGEADTGGMIGSLKLSGQASYTSAVSTAPELVTLDGVTRGTESVVSVVARNREDIKALAASVINAEAGHGASIRRAPKVSNMIIRGYAGRLEGFARAWLNTKKVGGKLEMRLTKKPLSGLTNERVLVTLARAKELN